MVREVPLYSSIKSSVAVNVFKRYYSLYINLIICVCIIILLWYSSESEWSLVVLFRTSGHCSGVWPWPWLSSFPIIPTMYQELIPGRNPFIMSSGQLHLICLLPWKHTLFGWLLPTVLIIHTLLVRNEFLHVHQYLNHGYNWCYFCTKYFLW